MGETTNLKNVLLISVFLVATTCCIAAGRTIYVDDDGPSDFNNIQAAIDHSNYGDTIIIADGTYTGPGNRDIDFHGKAITVRSENGPDNCIIDCQATITNLHRGFHFHSNEGPSSVIMGFTITSGYADYGGGVYCDSSDPAITNCRFIRNLAKIDGGGVYNSHSHPILTNCTFTNNGTYPGLTGHAFGGGMHNYYSSPTVIRCRFEGNYTAVWGGGMGNVRSSPLVINCAFIRNFGPGAGMFNTHYSSPTVLNCAFIGNGTGAGAGMFNNVESTPTVINCTFTGNRSDGYGGGMSNGDSGTTVINCIFWGNRDRSGLNQSSQIRGGTPIINYSCIQGWTGALGGVGNFGDDPLLVDIDGPDDILGTADDNVRLLAGSPCIDAGNSSAVPPSVVTDLDGGLRIRGHAVDMGVYESTAVLFVDADAPGPTHNGSSWATAFKCLPDALADAVSGEEIWVAQGVYFPDDPLLLGQASNPNPADGATGVNRKADLSWTAGSGATSHNVYFGTSSPLPFIGNQCSTTFDPGTMAHSTMYYWRIDEVNPCRTTTGTVWSFMTISLEATNPNPADGATGVSRTADLSWTAGPYATSHDVYFGTSSPPPFIQNQIGTTVDPGTMAYSTVYYWRIDELSDEGTITGMIWSFRTAGSGPSSPPPLEYSDVQDTEVDTVSRTATFQLKNGIAIRGGYAGFGEPQPNARDFEAYETILSGDLKGNDREVIDSCEFLNDPCRAENSYHVVTSSGCDETAILDGFTISAGNANGSNPYDRGGGMYNYRSSPTLVRCTFNKNAAEYHGGGMCNYHSSPTLTNCTFSGNSSGYFGGGMYNSWYSMPAMINCSFTGNTATGGGGMYNWYSCSPTLTNCTFSGNSAANGRTLACDSYQQRYQSNLQLTNCILWDGGNKIWNNDNSEIAITYSDVQGGWPGTGNIDTDPCFVDPGYWDTNGIWVEGDYHLMAGSACLDVGDNSAVQPAVLTDLDGGPRIRGPAVDMGAYERPVLLFVDADANGNNDGSSWADAYNYLQDALIVAFSGDKILVAEGVYNPDKGVGITPGEREATFQLINGVPIKGGYAGFGHIDPNAREVATYETILSGDLNGDDGPDFSNNGENSYHVITSSGTDETALLDGFTIIGGNANGNGAHDKGGGMFNESGNPTLTGCTFTQNSADIDGGGIYGEYTNPVITDCTFTGNLARNGGAINNRYSNPTLTNCVFSSNMAYHGGGMSIFQSNATLTNCIFTSNSANAGGGIFNWHMCSLVLTNCSFIGNLAQSGWSLACDSELQEHPSDIQVANCIFWHEALPPPGQARNPNPADGEVMVHRTSDLSWTAGPFATSHDVYFGTSNPPPFIGNQTATTFDPGTMAYSTTYYWRIDELNTWGITNGTTWRFTTRPFGPGSSPPLLEEVNEFASASSGTEISNADNSTISIIYSDVHGGWSGEGNIDTDPCFVQPGYWDNNDTRDDPEDDVWIEGDYHLLPESPCINAGDPNYIATPNETDLDGLPRVIGGRIDIGAYEYQNTPPLANAGPVQIVECACNTEEGTKVILDGTGSYDADGDPLTYTWTGTFIESPVHEATPTVTLEDGCPSEYVITLVVNDGIEDSEPNEVVITVVDTTPPEFTLSVTPTVLWPPDHKMVLITPSWTVSDECDATPDVSLVSIVANEGDDTIGDGHTSNDIQIGEDGSIYLRSERGGTSGDRIYTITYQAVDESGNATVRSATVSIPHDFKVLARIASRWLWTNPSGRIPEDLNGDGIVNLKDIAIFANNWIQ